MCRIPAPDILGSGYSSPCARFWLQLPCAGFRLQIFPDPATAPHVPVPAPDLPGPGYSSPCGGFRLQISPDPATAPAPASDVSLTVFKTFVFLLQLLTDKCNIVGLLKMFKC